VEVRAYPGPGRQNVSVSIPINRSTIRGCRMYLVYYIDKRLCVFSNEGTDYVTCIVARENGLNQGGELMQRECASDQASTGWWLKLRKKINQETIRIPRKTTKARLKPYRSRIQRSWGCQPTPSCYFPPYQAERYQTVEGWSVRDRAVKG
jgi:hypothetical protein